LILHIPTLLVALLAGFFLLCVQLAVAQRGSLRQPALRLWALGSWALLAGYFFLGARLLMPLWSSVLLGNGCIFVGMLLFNQALSVYLLDKPLGRWAWARLGFALLALVVMLPWTLAQRTAVVSLLYTMLLLPSVWLVLRHRAPREVALLMVGVTMAMSVAAMMFRFFHVLLAPGDYGDLLQPSLGQGLTFLISFIALLGSGFGFVLASFERMALRMEDLASLDGMTGCLNRSTTDSLLEHNLARSRREGSPLAFALIDLDHFKQINDRHGHRAGDAALKAVVHAIRTRLRKSDALGRMGGEEFGLILPATDAPGAQRLLDDVRRAVEQLDTQRDSSGQPIRLTMSAGIAAVASDSPADADRLYARADEALYKAKGSGRNRVCLWTPQPGGA
jgi:diguanylate cyclase (GGDEF)-like protein